MPSKAAKKARKEAKARSAWKKKAQAPMEPKDNNLKKTHFAPKIPKANARKTNG